MTQRTESWWEPTAGKLGREDSMSTMSCQGGHTKTLLLPGPDWAPTLTLLLAASISSASRFSLLDFLTYEIGAAMPTSQGFYKL